ncbi:carbonic anhydrase [Geobacter sp. DSM 9736]|uniref:beta-class carbonic anhydrase n=1 Tax=Geobacter sp. DSM 9736 TaxID=1277350 RepID=UPI000B503F24|nr:carbonic anhydrase [Geobacter sp. DSM 9736]SNB46578.1 carbonic anhydrase [Geobacter sp. DSM 9736]
MTLLDSILSANRKFTHPGAFPPLPKSPQKQLAIFTCMDTRLVDFLEPAMGIRRGEAKVIKNAGNTVIDSNGGVIRSLVAAIFLLGVEEVFVIGHRDCGMGTVDAEDLRARMVERGIDPQAIDSLEPGLPQWLGAFQCPEKNVEQVVSLIRNSPLIPKDVPIHGLLFCPDNGYLMELVRGYAQGEDSTGHNAGERIVSGAADITG